MKTLVGTPDPPERPVQRVFGWGLSTLPVEPTGITSSTARRFLEQEVIRIGGPAPTTLTITTTHGGQ